MEDIENDQKERDEQKKKTSKSIPSTLSIHFGPYSGLNPSPSLHSHSSNPLRYRSLLLLSIQLTKYANLWSLAFCLACFCLAEFLMSTKTCPDRDFKRAGVGCMFKDH